MQNTDKRTAQQSAPFTKGYVHVYTGDGKGKTTAAMGLALRAAGAGCKILIAQFFKYGDYSEIKALGQLNNLIHIKQFGAQRFITAGPTDSDKILFRKGLKQIKTDIYSKTYQMVIMDEANLAVFFGLLSASAIVDIIVSKPAETELIITGRYAHEKVVDAADLVTEMKEVKHYYRKGIQGRIGIEK